MNRWCAAACIALIALAAALRFPALAERPLHNDEGVNTIKFRDLYDRNAYRYDPDEFHGPTLPYFTLPAAWLSGARPFNTYTEALFRAVPACFGVGLVALIFLLWKDLGGPATTAAALLTALSPAMVYYSRDYIHETLLNFFTAFTLIALWRYARERKLIWVAVAGVSFGLMAATKETFVFSAAAALASAAVIWWPQRKGVALKPLLPGAALALPIASVVALLFFTSFGRNAAGAVDALRAYLPWLHRAQGASPHVHPWYFYFQTLRYESVLAAFAIVGGWRARGPLPRFLGLYALILAAIYCALPYKTPWCLLTFWQPILLLAGLGAVELATTARARPLGPLLNAATLCYLAVIAYQYNFGETKGSPLSASPLNPYVYAQTSPDVRRLIDTIHGLAAAAPEKKNLPLEIMSAESPWPLPWYLRAYPNVGYWESIPPQPLTPIVLANAKLNAAFDSRTNRTHLMAGYYQLRPGVFLELYVQTNLWIRYLATRPPDTD